MTNEKVCLGATGEFPEGKLSSTDKGELILAVIYEPKLNRVVLDFGTTMSLTLSYAESMQLSRMLVEQAKKVRVEF